jgi:peptidoglycan/LPS O-acetylase OafA/YrhL
MDDDNPYAPPKYGQFDHDLVGDLPNAAWRDGQLLVARKGAVLPDRCLKCNAPADGRPFKRSLSWASPYWALSILLIGPLLFLVVYVIFSRRGKVAVGLCPRHRKKRAQAIALGWFATLAGIVCIIGAGVASDSLTSVGIASDRVLATGIIVGIFLLLGGLIGGVVGSRVLVPTRIDKNFIWLSKVSPEYLASLPAWNM